jgi:hypothetical protein
LRWIRELRLCGAANVRYCLVVPMRKHLMVGLVPLPPFYSTSFGFFLSAQAKNVLTLQVTSFKPNCWPSSLPESETPRISPLVSVPSSKAMSDRCIHVVLSLFLESRRSGLPRIQITESSPEQDLISALCPQPHNQVPHKVHFFFEFLQGWQSHEIPRLRSKKSSLGVRVLNLDYNLRMRDVVRPCRGSSHQKVSAWTKL